MNISRNRLTFYLSIDKHLYLLHTSNGDVYRSSFYPCLALSKLYFYIAQHFHIILMHIHQLLFMTIITRFQQITKYSDDLEQHIDKLL